MLGRGFRGKIEAQDDNAGETMRTAPRCSGPTMGDCLCTNIMMLCTRGKNIREGWEHSDSSIALRDYGPVVLVQEPKSSQDYNPDVRSQHLPVRPETTKLTCSIKIHQRHIVGMTSFSTPLESHVLSMIRRFTSSATSQSELGGGYETWMTTYEILSRSCLFSRDTISYA